MVFRWRANDWQHIVVFGSSLPSSTKKRCQSWTPSDKTLWIRACRWAIMFYVRSPLSCAMATMCYPTLKTTTARGLKAVALILDIMLSLRLRLRYVPLSAADNTSRQVGPRPGSTKCLNVFIHSKGADKNVRYTG